MITVNFLFCEKTYRETDGWGCGMHAISLPGPHNIVVSIDSSIFMLEQTYKIYNINSRQYYYKLLDFIFLDGVGKICQ